MQRIPRQISSFGSAIIIMVDVSGTIIIILNLWGKIIVSQIIESSVAC
jgi:hypothetical protein